MNKRVTVEMLSYGRYEGAPQKGEIPALKEVTDRIPARCGEEFGMVLRVLGGRGHCLDYEIRHPRILNDKGAALPIFRGNVPLLQNDYRVFIGDGLWDPVEDKVGKWTISSEVAGYKGPAVVFHIGN